MCIEQSKGVLYVHMSLSERFFHLQKSGLAKYFKMKNKLFVFVLHCAVYLSKRLLHLVVQVFDLLLELFYVIQNLDSFFLYVRYFLFQLHALQSL